MDYLKLDQEQMQKRVVRFKDLKPQADLMGKTSVMPDEVRDIVAPQKVFGLTSPTGSSDRNFWDQGAVASGTPNFGAVYVMAAPGKGAGAHIHRYSYENFIVMKGRWRIAWNTPDKEEHVDLGEFDMVSVPPGAIRRFENIGDVDGVMLAFAYADKHSLTNTQEAIVAPCEVDRLEAALEKTGWAPYRQQIDGIRQTIATVASNETDEDRRFARQIAEFVAAEPVTA